MANRRSLESWRAACLFLMMTISQTLALNTFYTVEFPAYSFPAQEVSLVFTLEAPNAGSGPAPLSLTTVLDRSESMQGRKLELLKKTNQYLVEVMKKNSGKHDLGIVTYSNLLNELVGLQPVTSNTGPLMNYLISNIQAAGTTYLSGGLTKGLEQQKNNPTDKVQAVYLFTDGLPNIGATKSWEIINQIKAIRDHFGHHISIYTFGFGDDLDSNLLWDIAHEGDGVAYIISNEDDIPRAFGDAIGGLLSSVAQDVKVTFKPTDGARIKTIESPGDVSVLSDGSVEVRLSDLFAQETRDILVTVEAPETSNKGWQNMLYVDTTYKDAVTRKVTGQDTVYIGINREVQPVVVVPAERVEVVKIFYITSKVLEEAGDKAENGDDNGAKEKFEEAEKRILQSPLQNRPRLAGLLNDIRKVREAVVDKALNRARSGGILRNLVSSIRDQRSARTGTDQLESANALDTESKKEQRNEATQGVLGDRAFAVAPAPPGPLLGPVGRAVGDAIVGNIVDRISGSNSNDDSDDEDTDSSNSDENNDSNESNDEDKSSEDSNGDQKDDSNDSSSSTNDDTSEDSNGTADNDSEDPISATSASSQSTSTGASSESSSNGGSSSNDSEDSSQDDNGQNASNSDSSEDTQEINDVSQSDGAEVQTVEEEATASDTSAEDNSQNEENVGGVLQVTPEEQVVKPEDTTVTSLVQNSGVVDDLSTETNNGDESVDSSSTEAINGDDAVDGSSTEEINADEVVDDSSNKENNADEAVDDSSSKENNASDLVDDPKDPGSAANGSVDTSTRDSSSAASQTGGTENGVDTADDTSSAVPIEANGSAASESSPTEGSQEKPVEQATTESTANPGSPAKSLEEPGQQSVQPTEGEAQALPVVPAPVVPVGATAAVAAVPVSETPTVGV